MSRTLAAAALGALLLAAAGAQAQTVAVTNGRVMTAGPAGEIRNGTVLVRDGRIVAVGADVTVPAGARVIDAGGKIVTPGLIVADSAIGLTEVSSVSGSVDTQSTSASVTASFDVEYGLNPESITIAPARTGGITRAIVAPGIGAGNNSGLLFGGQAAVVHTGQSTDMLVKPRVAQVVELGEGGAARVGGARGAAVSKLKDVLDEVRFFARNREAYDEGDSRELSLSRADLEALVPVVEGRMPLMVGVSRASDIRNVLKLAREQKIRIILDGADEGWFVADDIAKAGVPVLLNPLSNLPGDFERLGASLQNAARLQAAGVTVVFKANEGGAHRARELRYNAGNAVAQGVPYQAALAAVTINPARVFGVADRVGSLEPGKDADLVIWDGDPFEPMSQPVAVFVQGREQSLITRGRMLAERYRDLNTALPPAYRK